MQLKLSFLFLLFANILYGQSYDKYNDKELIGRKLSFVDYKTIDNGYIYSSDLDNKIVILNFWFSSCKPCIAEIDGLNKLYDKFKDKDIEFIAFTFEDKESAIEFQKKYNLKYKIVCLSHSEIDEMKLTYGGYPTNIVVDKSGKIIYAKSGGHIQKEKATKEIIKNVGQVIEKEL